MANLPSQHPTLTLHLTDRALAPLITSAHSSQHQQLLTALSNTALNAHESASRLGLGVPQRIMVEHNEDGPLLLQTFLSPPAPRPSQPATNTATAASQSALNIGANTPLSHHQQGAVAEDRGGSSGNRTSLPTIYLHADEEPNHRLASASADRDMNSISDDDDDEEDAEDPDAPPMLLGIVVASTPDETPEARRAAVRLERVGREIQHRWTEMLHTQDPAPTARGTTDKRRRGAATD